MWNPDSTILAVWSEDLPNSSGENTFHKSHGKTASIWMPCKCWMV